MSLKMPREKIVSTWILAFLVMASVASLRLPAQEPAQKPQQQQSNSDHNRNVGPAHQLAEETREAAGEEKDSAEQFKQSAAVRFIARITSLSLVQSYWLCVLLNFIVITALIVWAWNKRVPEMFRTRTAGIHTAMFEAQKASEEARRRLAAIDSRLSMIDIEIGKMREAADQESATEEARVKATAEEEARKIVLGAQQEIAAAAKAARRQLTAHAADLAVGLAERQIRIDASTDRALVSNFAAELGTTPDNIGKDGN